MSCLTLGKHVFRARMRKFDGEDQPDEPGTDGSDDEPPTTLTVPVAHVTDSDKDDKGDLHAVRRLVAEVVEEAPSPAPAPPLYPLASSVDRASAEAAAAAMFAVADQDPDDTYYLLGNSIGRKKGICRYIDGNSVAGGESQREHLFHSWRHHLAPLPPRLAPPPSATPATIGASRSDRCHHLAPIGATAQRSAPLRRADWRHGDRLRRLWRFPLVRAETATNGYA